MASSMTGYGRGEAGVSDLAVLVELKSVNNRFRDVSLRLPREYLPLEPRILEALKVAFQRGRIEVYLRRTHTAGSTAVQIDSALFRAYQQAIRDLQVGEVPLAWVLSQPGVVATGDADVDVLAEWPVVEAALSSAIADLTQMRDAEGAALAADVRVCLDGIDVCVARIDAVVADLTERTREKLEARLRRLIGDRVDSSRLLQEAALVAERADVQEELVRLRSHLVQARDALDATEPVGRRLDFLLQEMGREVNTLGSKAIDHPVSEDVVSMKSLIERLREQAANLE